MNKLKTALWLIVMGFLALIIFQNEDYFLNTQQHLRLNLYFFAEYQSPVLPLAVFHLLFFIFGAGVAGAMSTVSRLRLRQANKRLRAAADAQEKALLDLKAELTRLKGEPLPGAPNGAGEASITSPIKPV